MTVRVSYTRTPFVILNNVNVGGLKNQTYLNVVTYLLVRVILILCGKGTNIFL